MATTENGLLRGLRGSVGPVVVSNGDGVSIVRIKPKKTTKAPQQSQIDQRANFKMVSDFVTQHQKLLKIGFQAYQGAVKPLNAVSSYLLKNAIIGTSPNYEFDFTKVKLSKDGGGLLQEFYASAAVATGSVLNITWDPKGLYNDADLIERNLDSAYVMAYDEVKGVSVQLLDGPTRDKGELSFRMPRAFIGDKTHVYFFFVSVDGKVSNTQYLGSVVPLT
ncbi:DUF6266 family protein [Pedobacter sp. L105]|uniref:DUF6266 family protein n=1 Tax=Pedobacter sp. L105 TaxID=1641871 RepID=UPI00131B4F27|nr:DUF6266 family protein [Pedobacter sp. L105]